MLTCSLNRDDKRRTDCGSGAQSETRVVARDDEASNEGTLKNSEVNQTEKSPQQRSGSMADCMGGRLTSR